MKQQAYSGTGVALVTPFKEDKAIDFEALERIIEHVITGGVDFIVSLGTTGEAITLTAQECRQVLDFTIEKVNSRMPVVAGLFGGNFTQKIVDGIRNYDFDGIDAIMSSSPAYSKPSQEGIFQHYMKISEVSPRPIIIYNVPGRTCSNVLPETVLRLAEASDKFIAVKEASGDVVQTMKIAKNKPEDFLILSGDDPLTLPIIASGGSGVISVIANAFPREFSTLVRAALNGDYEAARGQNANLLDVHPWLYVEGNPSGVKAAMEHLGLCRRDVRIPQTSVSEQTFQALKAEIDKVK